MKEVQVLFISNSKYIDSNAAEGGVKLCTQEYIDLIATSFKVLLFPVALNKSFAYRIKKKIGIAVYQDYSTGEYLTQLRKVVSENNIDLIFLNLTNTITFSLLIKKNFPAVKIILCSHGNESGDFLHEIALHKKFKGFKKIIAHYALGKMLCLESEYRNNIDIVLTVSEVEEHIEKWIGAENVKMIARTIPDNKKEHQPVKGRVGFFGDLSHSPNFFGIKMLCDSLLKLHANEIELRLVGTDTEIGQLLHKKYAFVNYLGYLSEGDLEKEIITWTFALNPVFYYSRGVSTKLGKALSWGLPVITTLRGMRGYQWQNGELLNCNSPTEMAILILKYSKDLKAAAYYRNQIELIKATAPGLQQMMNDVISLLQTKN